MKPYMVILSPDPNHGGYVVSVPAMRGALTQADSRTEALAAAAEVMALWLEVAAEAGYGPAEETSELIAQSLAQVWDDRAAEGWDWSVELVPVRPAAMAAA